MHLNGENYLQFLQEELPELLEDVPLDVRRRMWFQHDGAPVHSTRIVRDWLDQRFPGRWIGRGGPVSWPLRSPDLNPLDFFLWGHVKAYVYTTSKTFVPGLMRRWPPSRRTWWAEHSIIWSFQVHRSPRWTVWTLAVRLPSEAQCDDVTQEYEHNKKEIEKQKNMYTNI